MQRRSEFFATCPPGLARLLRDRLAATAGVEVTASGCDGESDIVLFDADRDGRMRAAGVRLADGVFAVAARARRDGGTDPAAVAARCWQRESAQRALSLWAERVRPLSPAMTYRITARMQTGPRALRLGLRAALADVIRRDRPRWQLSGQGELEICLSEWRDGELVTGLRVGGNRPVPAASVPAPPGPAAPVPPSVAAAMVALAGPPEGVLLDPCSGGGVVLAEAVAAGWTAEGLVPDPGPAGAAEIPEDDAALGACVARLPPGTRPDQLAGALNEMSRVTRSGGAVVLLAAEVPRTAWPPALRLRRQVPVRLAAGRETIWVYRRA